MYVVYVRVHTRWIMLWRITSKTQYNLDSYLSQIVPALANTFAMRMLYDIRPGNGQIAHVDQSMHYRWYDQHKVFKIVR